MSAAGQRGEAVIRTDAPASDVYMFPTSFAQQRLWFLDQLVPGNAFYNLDSAVPMSMTPADVPVLERTLNEIVRRHESLRTTFTAVDGQPVQVIQPRLHVPLPVIDLRSVPSDARRTTASRRAEEEARRPFDLAAGPLMRTTLLRTGESDYMFLLTMHHIVADGLSIGIFWKELSAIWQALERGLPSPLPELPIQYADFAVWQRKWLDDGAADEHLTYWRAQLANLPTTEVPGDWPRPEVQSFIGATHVFWIPAALQVSLRQLSQSQGATLFMTLLAAFQALLSRYTGHEDIVVGAPIANRNRAEIEGLIGFFVNSLVLRTNLSGDPPFTALLQRVRETALGAYAHQDLPFERLVQELQPERDMSRHPLFQVSFQLFTADDERSGNAADSDEIDVQKATANIDFALDMWEYADGIYASVEYSTDLYREETIARFAGHYLTLLQGIVSAPDARVSTLPLLTEAERHRQLFEWNATAAVYDDATCVSALFEAQVARTPSHIAISGPDGDVSYAELDERSNRLAHHLRERGVGRGDVVAICVERSIDLVVAVLGVAKSGGAFLPLEPSNPRQRTMVLLDAARPVLLMTQGSIAVALTGCTMPCLLLDADRAQWMRSPGSSPRVEVGPDQLAYVMYTSGSTGMPKGVMVANRSLCNHLLWARHALPLTSLDRMAMKYSIAFDAALLEMFAPLLAGARLVIVPPMEHFDSRELVRIIARENVTVLDLVPSMLRVLLEEPEFAECRSLRRVVCGGEVLRAADEEQFFGLMNAELHNAYGPTEGTIGATLWTCRRSGTKGAVPIGRPIANTQIYILDRHMNPVPVGVIGEMWIGGHGVALGYLRDTDLTGQRFVPDPFSGSVGARLYRTGDRAKYSGDGTIEFIGRTDDQIKLRGIRLEPGEVEACLLRHPSVASCAVVAQEAGDATAHLVGYIVPADEAPELWPSIGEYFAYDELAYLAMTYDERRNAMYSRTIARLVPGKTVVDIGTGADACLARLCVEAGAAHVYAIEALDDAYARASDLIGRLGLAESVTLVHGNSMDLNLPEPVDICVSELLGTIGSSEGAAVILNDARRFLKPDGMMIPARALTRVAAITLPDQLAVAPRLAPAGQRYAETIFERAGGPFDVRVCLKSLPREDVVSDAAIFEDLDFLHGGAVESSARIRLSIHTTARLDGFLLWLNVYASDGESIDVRDGQTNWLPVFFPAFYPGVSVEAGDVIEAECSRNHTDPVCPDYRVKGRLIRRAGSDIEFDYHAPYMHRTFKGTPFYEALFEPDREHSNVSRDAIEQVARWQHVYDELYRTTPELSDTTFNTTGWNSSYTGQPMHEAHLREQVDATVARIMRLRPQHVLEIGCGTGLLLFPLAARCTRYVATDFSATALDCVRRHGESSRLTNVEFLNRSADDFSGLAPESFDTVVLNSVIQYFPSVAYLVRVLEGAVRVLKPGGHIFLGDVRSLPLLDAFYASVELSAGDDGVDVAALQHRLISRRTEEHELALAPAFFAALRQTMPDISRVELQLKRGWHHNELTRFRLDASLAVKSPSAPERVPRWIDWHELASTEAIAAAAAGEPALAVRGVPNARVRQELSALARIVDQRNGADDAESDERQTSVVEPEEIWALAGRLDCEVVVSPSTEDPRGAVDVLLHRCEPRGDLCVAEFGLPEGTDSAALTTYATDPLRGDRARRLVPALNRYLKSVLPEQMVPSAMVLLTALPRTAAGKVDRKALPSVTRISTGDESLVAPRNDVEQRLAAIWAEVLKYRRVGIHDNFFTHLGGHSLLATQLVSRLRDAFGVDLPLRRLFEAPTIAELALVIEDALIDIIRDLDDEDVKRLVEEQGGYLAES